MENNFKILNHWYIDEDELCGTSNKGIAVRGMYKYTPEQFSTGNTVGIMHQGMWILGFPILEGTLIIDDWYVSEHDVIMGTITYVAAQITAAFSTPEIAEECMFRRGPTEPVNGRYNPEDLIYHEGFKLYGDCRYAHNVLMLGKPAPTITPKGEVNMKSAKTFVSPFANMVSETHVKDDLVNLRRLAKVLNMIADKADNKMSKRDDEVLVASMYPNVPHITFGQVRAAMEEVDMIEDSHKEAAMVMPTGRRLKEIGKTFSLPPESKHRNRLPKYRTYEGKETSVRMDSLLTTGNKRYGNVKVFTREKGGGGR